MNRLPLLLALALPLAAQDASLGLRAHGLAPMGDLRDLTHSQVGLGLAAFVDIPVGGGLVLRPLVGGQYLPEKTAGSPTGAKVRVSSVDLMLDALWYPGESAERGPYLVCGAGGQMWRVSVSGSETLSHTRLGLNGGLGYQASPRLSFEARGFWSPIAPDLTATGLMLGATLRF